MSARTKGLFLDRDGVINVDRCYVRTREEFQFREGIFELCRAAQELGYTLLVVTNQSGIARGYYSEAEFLDLSEWMIRQFAEREIRIARVYYCPYHPTHGIGKYKVDSPDRKPNPGLLLRAQVEFNLDLQSSALIGDKFSDIEAANAAGVSTKILLPTNMTEPNGSELDCHIVHSLDEIRRKFFCRELKMPDQGF
jgi:D-glycero-D-manno-heptose 1,7-bisphosphate phosphatase